MNFFARVANGQLLECSKSQRHAMVFCTSKVGELLPLISTIRMTRQIWDFDNVVLANRSRNHSGCGNTRLPNHILALQPQFTTAPSSNCPRPHPSPCSSARSGTPALSALLCASSPPRRRRTKSPPTTRLSAPRSPTSPRLTSRPQAPRAHSTKCYRKMWLMRRL